MKEKYGEYIPLYWDGAPLAYYVKGHVSAKEAYNAVCINIDVTLISVVHKWARWVFRDEFTLEGCDFQLKVYDHPSQGAFKVTEVKY